MILDAPHWAVLGWFVLAGLALAAAAFLSLWSWSRFARSARGPVTTALPIGGPPTGLDRLLDPVQALHPGQQGLFNLLEGQDAFATRVHACRQAGRSLDIITYIWAADMTGWLMMSELIAAANRGVRVRLLLDDVHVQGLDPVFLGLSQHPMIEVRLFNPLRNRGLRLRQGWEFLLGLSRFNRRIHSKAWIADNRLAILGGRNVGDVYFGAVRDGRQEAEDADIALAGVAVDQVSAIFDAWWNLGLSLPIRRLWPKARLPRKSFLKRVQRHIGTAEARSYMARALRGRSAEAVLVDRLRWTRTVEILSDPVEKAFGQRKGPWLSSRIEAAMRGTHSNLRIITPYFVPGTPGMSLLSDLRQRGVEVTLLTNSLATTDVSLVHGAYSWYRRPLLDLGVRVHEMVRRPGQRRGRSFLHSKVFLFDDRQALIGSANFDLRSANLNIEIGLIFEEPQLMAELLTRFGQQIGPGLAWDVQLENGRIVWRQDGPGGASVQDVEPTSSLRRLLLARLMRIVPHDYL